MTSSAVPTVLVVENDPADPIARLGEWLTAAGVRLDVRGPEALPDTLPDNLDGYAGLVVMGGVMGAEEDERAPWLPQVRALLRRAVAAEVPTLGVCLGAQLLAVANGGRVQRNPDGPEFGAQLVAKRASAATDPLFGTLPITPDVIQWHVDAVTRLPAGAIHLASSPSCENQAFRVGRLAWGIQFHIETEPETVRRWAAADADALAGYDVARLLARSDAVHADLAEAWQPFAETFAAVVRDPSSVPAGRAAPGTATPVTDPAAIRAALAAQAQSARHPVGLQMPYRPPRRPD